MLLVSLLRLADGARDGAGAGIDDSDDVGIDEKELDYYAGQVREASNNLESKVYEMEEVFEDRLRDLKNAVDDLQMEIDYPEDYQ